MRKHLLLAAVVLTITLTAAISFTVGASSHVRQIPVAIQLLANDGNVYANAWVVDGVLILEDPEDKLKLWDLPADCGG